MSRWSSSIGAVVLTLAVASPLTAQEPPPAAAECGQHLAAVTEVQLDGDAFYPLATRDGCWIFVTLGGGRFAQGPYGVAVLQVKGSAIEEVRFAAGIGVVLEQLPTGIGPGLMSRLGANRIVGASRTSRTLHVVDIRSLQASRDGAVPGTVNQPAGAAR